MDDDELAQEAEAMEAIFGDDLWKAAEWPSAFVLCASPECDAATETVGAVALSVTLPAGYPHTASASIEVSGLAGMADRFPHRAVDGTWQPGADQATAITAAVQAAIADRPGDSVVFDAVDAAKSWLEGHTLAARPEQEQCVSDQLLVQMATNEVSEDDLELDEEDMDEEMIEAMGEVIEGGKLARQLDEAAQLKDGSKKQRAALHAIFVQLTPSQRRQMVALSGSDCSDEDSDSESEVEEPPPPKASGGGKAGKAGGSKAAPSCPPPAKRACPRGHALTASSSKPDDYKKLDGGVGNCDVCDGDFKYSKGGYHCCTCRNWDCCVGCGSIAAQAGGASKGKSKKRKK